MCPGSLDSSLVSSSSAETLWQRYEFVMAREEEKNAFLQDALQRYEYLHEQYKRECEEHDRARERNSALLRNVQALESSLCSMRVCLEKDPFVLVLIDGDGMIFRDELWKEGEAGGRKAASLLYSAVAGYVQQSMQKVPMDVKIVCRVFAHVKGLGEILVRTGVTETIIPIQEFVCGFTRARSLFDFVDVGPGKDRADEKITATFRLYLNDLHCRQLFLGCSHDNGYARALEELSTDRLYLDRITLLEGVPFEKELAALPFDKQKFGGIFRDSKLLLYGSTSVESQPASRSGSASLLPLVEDLSALVPATKATPKASPSSWASKLAAPPPERPSTPQYVAMPRKEQVPRNRAGQRVDPPPQSYDKDELHRLKGLKLCNVHFLRPPCPHGTKCPHLHDYKPTQLELDMLRLVARMSPCQVGAGCHDAKCIYGHRCPFSEARSGAKGGKTCNYGDKCKFPAELHGIDTTVVHTVVVR